MFEKLRDTVDAIPTSLIEAAEQRYVAFGAGGIRRGDDRKRSSD
jgi:hypothetical protein